jgi:hypothetical protein
MSRREGRIAVGVAGVLSAAVVGCTVLQNFTNVLNPDLLSSLGLGVQVASLPGDAPGLLVAVDNRTSRWAAMTVAYRMSADQAKSFTTNVAPRNKSAQMLICPVTEITVGDVSNTKQSGARVYLIENVTDTAQLETAPFIEVDVFGVLLVEGVNYDCGDGVTFAIQESSISQSGYQIYAYVRRSGQ